ncbi:hypothetical protein DFJ77DRAFT_455645 [Powellomyces hirtus]|nr:hypothetical protein DFJ77DRAFT_455645 [Powellomyces hirtus]
MPAQLPPPKLPPRPPVRKFVVSPPATRSTENLDSAGVEHLRALTVQSLKEIYVDVNVWERVLVDVALEIAQDLPYVLKIVGRPQTVAPDTTAQPGKDAATERQAKTVHHVVQVSLEPSGMPQDSRYIPGTRDAKHSLSEDSSDSNSHELGGTVILHGVSADLRKLKRVMDLLIFAVCSMKLEMNVLLDHFVTRATDASLPSASDPNHHRKRRAALALWHWFRGVDHNETESGTPQSSASSSSSSVINGNNRFDRAIDQISRAILSVSPGLRFPPPHLLRRLRDEESLGPTKRDERRQSYAVDDVVGPLEASGTNGRLSVHGRSLQYSRNRESTASLSSRSSYVSVDSKAGLAYLMTNNNSISGVINHQRITFAYSYALSGSHIPCRPPEILTNQYYQKEGHNQDQTLGELVAHLCTNATAPCSDIMCGKPMREHVVSYSHGTGQIDLSVQSAADHFIQDAQFALSFNNNECYMWTSCSKCSAATKIVPMSLATWHYSFAKYLELHFYSSNLCHKSLCAHGHVKENVKLCFRWRDEVVVFVFKPIDLFEMRVPRIQVSPEHHLREPIAVRPLSFYRLVPEENDSSVDLTTPKTNDPPLESNCEVLLDILEALRLDITHFFHPLFDHISKLQEETGVTPRMSRSECTPEQVRCLTRLDEMSKRFKKDEESLYKLVEALQESDAVNTVRQEICMNICACVAETDSWTAEAGIKLSAPPQWCFPEYCISSPSNATSKCCIYPNSHVLVREEELTSIIAFTLSSKEYRHAAMEHEIAHPPASEPPVSFPALSVDQWHTVEKDCELKIKHFSHEATTPPVSKVSSDIHPHTKFKFRTKTHTNSCVIYYAKAFSNLRRKCGMTTQYVESLSRCSHWDAVGGKSSAGFFKTADDALVVKRMASRWANTEKAAFMKFAPHYFQYMDQSEKNPTVLVKIFGFYTIKRKNLQTGAVVRLDVLVMEHLFANVMISRKFDLKGVPDRHVVSKKDGDNDVMWDGDWVDGRYTSLLRLHGHSKKILMDSIINDTQFLASSNIMDYSLLVGINDARKELVVGIVDFIGPYTWYKVLETRAKITLNAALKGGKGVTVLPPPLYGERFRKAMDQNFLMVPDKWIKLTPGPSSKVEPTLPPVL